MKEGFKEGTKALYNEVKTWNIGYKIERTFALTASLVWGFFAIGLLYVAYQLTTVEGEIDASIFEKDKEAGTYSIGHVKTKKYAPKIPKRDNNMVGIGVNNYGIRTYHYKRRLWTPLGLGIWGGIFVNEGIHPRLGQEFSGGLSLSISF